MKGLLPILKKEMLEIIRSKKLFILIIIFVFTSVSSPIIAKMLPELMKSLPETAGIIIRVPEPTWRDAIDQLVKNTAQFGLLVLIFMFSGSIAEEKNKKTLEMVLTKPVSRTGFVLAKFIAGGVVLKLVFIFSAIIFYFYTSSLFGSFSIINYFWLSLFLLIYLLTILSTSIFFSTLFYNQVISAGVTLIAGIATTTIIGYIDQISKYSPAYILSGYKELMGKGGVSDFLPSAVTSIMLIILLVVGSIVIFKNQEVER